MKTFVVTGMSGVGKSSFINAVFGVNIAPVDRFRACTKLVKHYADQTSWGPVCVVDTPGLREDTEQLDREYLQRIRKDVRLKEVDAVLYLTRLTETRTARDEISALALITDELGRAIWRSAWLVFTCCASVHPKARHDTFVSRCEQIETCLFQVGVQNPFQKYLLHDSVVPNWVEGCRPVASLLV